MTFTFLQISPEVLRLHCESREAAIEYAGLTGRPDALLPEDFLRPWAQQMLPFPDWLGFWVILGSEVVGSGGYKDAPRDRWVEIGYGIHESCWGQGAATALCQRMVEHAFAHGVTTVRAHTLPDGHASQAVLRKNGFELIGEVVEPEDGLVLRWERRTSQYTGAGET
ncbi:MAG: GNAT family N-acetyltransferase [Armatimonadetes bacterium]|nr:GNAT family N-acetyltransferase [Armatimonadota bacterium]